MSPFFLLFMENFLFGLALNSTSLLPPYLESLGASQTFVGFYNIVGTLLIVVAVVFFGRPLVRLPRVRALRWGFFLLFAASVCSWFFAHSLVLLALFKLVGALSQVFAWTLMMSLLFDVTPAHKRASSVALYGVAGIVTNPVASLAGEAVLRTWGGPGLFLLAAAFALLSWLWSLLFREPAVAPAADEPASFAEVARRRDLGPLLALSFSFGVYFSALAAFIPGHTQRVLGEANLSAFLIPFSVVSVVLRVVLGGQLDRRGPRRFLVWSFTAIGAGMVCFLLPAHWAWIALAGFLYGIGHSILFPLLSALFVSAGGEDQKAVYSNAYMVANLLGATLLTPVLGVLGDLAGFRAVAAVLGVLALVSVVVVRRRFPRPAASPPSARSS